jgi:hypothetical protein
MLLYHWIAILKTLWQRRLKLLVLVPHRDVQFILRKYGESLFRAGFCGAYSFPWVAPLAVLSRSFNDDELKHCTRAIRETSFPYGGKFNTVESSVTALDDDLLLFGPRLDIDLPKSVFMASSKMTRVISPPVISTCLFPSDGYDAGLIPPSPQVSFRAAAVTNMIWTSNGSPNQSGGEFCCKWKIGKLCWLPHPSVH